MEPSRIVSHFGIHVDDTGVAFLEQGRGSTNAAGLSRKSGLEVRLPSRKQHCNHQIPLASPVPHDHHWEFFGSLLDDPLARAMLPVPKSDGGVFYIAEDPRLSTVLVLLAKLSSPIYNVIVPIWMLNKTAIVAELQSTNVQPFVLAGVEPKHSMMLAQLAEATVYLPRTLVLCGCKDVPSPPGAKRLTTRLTDETQNPHDLIGLPWEQLGAAVVRKHMRHDWHI
jgi:hypothetical protein